MNKVMLIGRLTKDPVTTTAGDLAIARFSVAIDRATKEKQTDFPNCVAFGKTAEIIGQYFHKGKQIAIEGHLQTGAYEKDGAKVYTTDVVVDRLEFVGSREDDAKAQKGETVVQGYAEIDEDIPF